jgi:hypothetical protein
LWGGRETVRSVCFVLLGFGSVASRLGYDWRWLPRRNKNRRMKGRHWSIILLLSITDTRYLLLISCACDIIDDKPEIPPRYRNP